MCYDQEKNQDVRNDIFRARVEANLRSERDAVNPAGGMAGGLSGCAMSDKEILSEFFSYHQPTPITLPKFAAINQAAKNFAEVVLQNCPPSADRSDAIRKIREARMTANAAVALNGLSL